MKTLLLLLMLFPWIGLSQAAAAQDAAAEIDRYLEGLVKKGQFSGHVHVSMKGVELSRGYGRLRFPDGQAPDEDSAFKIGSLTKQFTGFAILDLVDAGALSLEDPVSRFFPEVKPDFFGKDGKPVTIQDLLTHRSGLPDVTVYAYHWGGPVRFGYFLQWLEWISDRIPPGAIHQYSNFNYFLLGEILTRVTGVPYEEHVKRHFFDPLRMTSTAMTFQNPSRRAYGHSTVFEELIPAADVHGYVHGTYDWPQASDGGLVATVHDLKLWVDHLSSRKEPFARYQTLWSKEGYFAGLVNKGTVEKPLYWHNGALSPIGYNSDLVFDHEGTRIIVLANVNMMNEVPNLALKIHAFLDRGEALPELSPFHSLSSLIHLIVSRIRLGILLSIVCIILLYRKRKEPNFGLTSFGYFSSGILVNSFAFPRIESYLALAIMLLVWVVIATRRTGAKDEGPILFKGYLSPAFSLLFGLLMIYNKL